MNFRSILIAVDGEPPAAHPTFEGQLPRSSRLRKNGERT
jgi:hypothetical protein